MVPSLLVYLRRGTHRLLTKPEVEAHGSGRDRLFRRHPGTHQPPNDLREIDSMNAGAIQNSIHALAAAFIEQDAQQGGGIQQTPVSRARALFILTLRFRPAIPNQFLSQIPTGRNILADLLADFR